MRQIDNQELRRAADLNELQGSNAAIAILGNDQRKTFLNDHEDECSALRHHLWTIGEMKCWYSEKKLQECEGQVEHYRPKKRLSGVRHSGYWWRAFDWRNLRLAHPTVNRRKTDYLSGKRVGKGSYFPLRNEATRAQNQQEEANEEPVLLDPVIGADTRLLCFSEEGAPRPRFTREQDEWRYRRAEESIDYYHLDEVTWNVERADLMAIVRKLCEQLENIFIDEPRDEDAYERKIDEINAYLRPYAEFSSACRQVVVEKGLWSEIGE